MLKPARKSKPLPGCVVAFLFMLIVAAASAPSSTGQTTSTWTDGTGNWSNPLNWDSGVPNGDYNAVVNEGSVASTITLDMNASINTLNFDAGASIPGIDTLNIASGNSLAVAQSFTNRGTVQIESNSSLTLAYGDMKNFGSINVNDGGTLTLVAAPGSVNISSPGNINLNSTGSLTTLSLDGENAYFGKCTVSSRSYPIALTT